MRTWIVPLSTGTGVTGGANFELPADIKHHKCVGLTPAPFGPVRTPGGMDKSTGPQPSTSRATSAAAGASSPPRLNVRFVAQPPYRQWDVGRPPLIKPADASALDGFDCFNRLLKRVFYPREPSIPQIGQQRSDVQLFA
jgi:hypothetical protein